jgi:hypothetical protein
MLNTPAQHENFSVPGTTPSQTSNPPPASSQKRSRSHPSSSGKPPKTPRAPTKTRTEEGRVTGRDVSASEQSRSTDSTNTKKGLGDILIGQMVAFNRIGEGWMTSALYGKIREQYLEGVITKKRMVKETVPATNDYGDILLDDKNKPMKYQLLSVEYEIKWSCTEFNGTKFTHWIPRDVVQRGKL